MLLSILLGSLIDDMLVEAASRRKLIDGAMALDFVIMYSGTQQTLMYPIVSHRV